MCYLHVKGDLNAQLNSHKITLIRLKFLYKIKCYRMDNYNFFYPRWSLWRTGRKHKSTKGTFSCMCLMS